MILSDRDIKKYIQAEKLIVKSKRADFLDQIHASSMDFRLGNTFKIYKHSKFPMLDPKNMPDKDFVKVIEVKKDEPFIVQPGEFVLGVTEEIIGLPDNLVARVEGRSSLGRLGLLVHATAGFVDPGFYGTITLEISNINRLPIALYPGQRVGQFAFETMTSSAEIPYHKKSCSKYQGQILPEESRLKNDPEFN
jgi:dCTP deaminase